MVPRNDDPQESRPPTLEDLIQLCRRLNEKNAKYIVIGGWAMVQHGFTRATEDIDLLVETSLANEKIVLDTLAELPDGASKELKPGEISQFEVIKVADEIVIDLMKVACNIDYAAASKSIQWITLEGVKIPFANVDLMIQLKGSVRPKDKMDLEFLKGLKQSGRG